MSHHCSICVELGISTDSRMAGVLEAESSKNAVLGHTPDLAVVPTIGPLTFGHCLIVSRSHETSLLSNSSYKRQLYQCLDMVNAAFCSASGKVLLVGEHGDNTGALGASLCSTTHAHVHAVPMDQHTMNRATFDLSKVAHVDFHTLRKELRTRSEYGVVLERTQSGRIAWYSIQESDELDAQWFRKRISRALGHSEWNWRQFPRAHVIKDMTVGMARNLRLFKRGKVSV